MSMIMKYTKMNMIVEYTIINMIMEYTKRITKRIQKWMIMFNTFCSEQYFCTKFDPEPDFKACGKHHFSSNTSHKKKKFEERYTQEPSKQNHARKRSFRQEEEDGKEINASNVRFHLLRSLLGGCLRRGL